METITLKHPIWVNGQEMTELTHDMDEITIEQFAEAEARKFKSGTASVKGATLELDYSMQIYLGMAAIIAVNPTFTFEDLERIKGSDLRLLFGLGRNFTTGGADENLREELLEEASESIPEPSTPPNENLEETVSLASSETTKKPVKKTKSEPNN